MPSIKIPRGSTANLAAESKKSIKPKRKPALYWACFALVLIFAVYNAFWGLDNDLISDWDEARHGVNAIEMLENENFIVNTYDGEADYYNVKPPISSWFMALSFRIFGYNLIGMRFFSALCLPIIALSAMLFLNKYCGSWASICCGAIFACYGMRFFHLFRTGDPDALFFLCCFFTCMFLAMAYLKSPKHLIGAGLFVSLAFLSKSMHVFPLLLVVALSMILLRKAGFFRTKEILLYLLMPMALPALAWAILRYSYDGTTFFRYLFELDVLNRVTTVVEGHSGGFGYYFGALHYYMGAPLFWGVVASTLCALIYSGIQARGNIKVESSAVPEKCSAGNRVLLTVFGLMAVIPIIVFTAATTKLGWYVFPSLIGFAFLPAWALQTFACGFKDKKNRLAVPLGVLCAALIFIGIITPPFDYTRIDSMNEHTSAANIFSSLPSGAYKEFYMIDANGGEISMPQSLLLYSKFAGMSHIKGGLNEYLEYRKTKPETLVIVRSHSPDELRAFYEANQPLNIVEQIFPDVVFN